LPPRIPEGNDERLRVPFCAERPNAITLFCPIGLFPETNGLFFPVLGWALRGGVVLPPLACPRRTPECSTRSQHLFGSCAAHGLHGRAKAKFMYFFPFCRCLILHPIPLVSLVSSNPNAIRNCVSLLFPVPFSSYFPDIFFPFLPLRLSACFASPLSALLFPIPDPTLPDLVPFISRPNLPLRAPSEVHRRSFLGAAPLDRSAAFYRRLF